jgi:hypothetical protein
MSEWWSYHLSDLLLFSPRTYWRLFDLHNQALWPLQLLMLALGAVALALAGLRRRHHGRLIAILLAVLWIWVGWSFLWLRYATINWAAIYVAPVFALEALLLVILGGVLDRLSAGQSGVRRGACLALVAVALAYPLLSVLPDRSWQRAEVFGIAPDPTAIATLGFALLARGGAAAVLLIIPLLWCLVSATTLWAMGDWQALAPLAAILATAAACVPARSASSSP